MSMPLLGNWNYPTAIRFGAGRIRELPEACKVTGLKRPLLVGKEMTEKDLAQREITIMADKALPYEVLKKVMSTCTDADYGKVSLAVIQKEKPVVAGQFQPG